MPEKGRKIKQLRISKSLLFFLSFFCLLVLGLFAWGIQDYRVIKTQIPRLAQLEKENNEKKRHLIALTQRINLISQKMMELKEFDQKLRVMVNLEPGEEDKNFLGIGGSDPTLLSPDYTIEKAHQKLIRLMHQSLDNLNTEMSIQIDEKAELHKFLKNQKSMLASTPSVRPTKGWVSSRFGPRNSPFTNQKEFHRGVDISSRMKTPIIAPADGIVASISYNHGYGKLLSINHGYRLNTKYGHLAKVLVKKGQYVKRGQKIALVGNTGRTTGPHLHYEVYLNGVPVDPFRYILD